MEKLELEDYLADVERGHGSKASLSALWKDLGSGRVTHDEILEHYAEANRPRLVRLVGIFGSGNLFVCQKQGFDDWIAGREYKRDFDTYLDLRSVYDMAYWKPPRPGLGESLVGFISRMVLVSPSTRKELVEKHGFEHLRKRWLDRRIKEGWEW